MKTIVALIAALLSCVAHAETSAINGELKELTSVPLIDRVSLPIYVGAPDLVAAPLWKQYQAPPASLAREEIMLTRLAIPDITTHSEKVVAKRRQVLRQYPEALLPLGLIDPFYNGESANLFQGTESARVVVGDTSSLVCSESLPKIRYCVRLLNVGKKTAPVMGVRVPVRDIVKYNQGYANSDRLIGAYLIRRTADKPREENGAWVVNATARKAVIFDPVRGTVLSGNFDMDIRKDGDPLPEFWVKNRD